MNTTGDAMGKLRNMTSIYLTCGEKILLLYRQGSRVVNNVWVGSAGGHFEPQELSDAKACVLRELYEELQVTEDILDDLALRYITLRRTADEIRQNYYFFAQLKDADKLELKSSEGELKWFDADEIPGLPMPFTAQYVLSHWLKEGRGASKMYGGITTVDGVVFAELVCSKSGVVNFGLTVC